MATKTKAGPQVCIKTITPKYAAELLEKNYEGQRKPNLAAVEQFTRLILEDKWRVTNDAVTLSVDDKLINGQHRLLACIASGRPIDVNFMTGAEEDIYKVIDNGVGRSSYTLLAGAGISYGKQVTPTLRFLWQCKRNIGLTPSEALFACEVQRRDCTPSEMLEIAEGCRDELHEACRVATVNSGRKKADSISPLEPGRIILFHFFAKECGADPSTTLQFIAELVSNRSELRSSCGPRKLRDDALARRASRVRLPQPHTIALMTKAYNAYVDGRPIHRIAYDGREEFPKVLPGPCKSTDQ